MRKRSGGAPPQARVKALAQRRRVPAVTVGCSVSEIFFRRSACWNGASW